MVYIYNNIVVTLNLSIPKTISNNTSSPKDRNGEAKLRLMVRSMVGLIA